MGRSLIIILFLFVAGCSEIKEETPEPRNWKEYCKNNDDKKHCWGGDKAPWLGGPFCTHEWKKHPRQAPGTTVRCTP